MSEDARCVGISWERQVKGKSKKNCFKHGRTWMNFQFWFQIGSPEPWVELWIFWGIDKHFFPNSAYKRFLHCSPLAYHARRGLGIMKSPWYEYLMYEKVPIIVWTNFIHRAKESFHGWANLIHGAKESFHAWANLIHRAKKSFHVWAYLIHRAKKSFHAWANLIHRAKKMSLARSELCS